MKNFIKKFIPKFVLGFYHKSLAIMADFIYRHPSGKLIVIGVTGTNGKSTVVNLIGRVLEEAGFRVGWTSTVNFKVDKKEWLNKTKMTMLGRFGLQKMISQMVKAGCQYAIIETSSEGIKQFRHLGIAYDIGVFTNLTPEHIESHGSFENYKRAKGKLFEKISKSPSKQLTVNSEQLKVKRVSVINIDDEHAPYFLQFETDEGWGYGIEGRGKTTLSRVATANAVRVHSEGVNFVVQDKVFNLKIFGEFNVYNALASIAVALSQGADLETCRIALEKITGIPGRMEFINEGQNFKVLVDYAPEPESMKKLYGTLEDSGIKSEAGKIIHVLGSCGGGRDVSRRPVLGSIAGEKADIVIITNEDPYDDDPQMIIDEVARGALEKGKVLDENLFKILDRGEAIQKAVDLAEENDLVLITGKGSEQAIVVKDNKKIPWDDREKAREAVRNRVTRNV